MGMSASQARLIQLTARMSDVEYEGQQINQQRLNLANQSASINEQALSMPVPTVPSVYDYPTTSYSAKQQNGHAVTVDMSDSDTLEIGIWQYGVASVSAAKDSEGNEIASGTISSGDVPASKPSNIKPSAAREIEVTVSAPALRLLTDDDRTSYPDCFTELTDDEGKGTGNFEINEKGLGIMIPDTGADPVTKTFDVSELPADLNAFYDLAYDYGKKDFQAPEGAKLSYEAGETKTDDPKVIKALGGGFTQDDIDNISEKYFAFKNGEEVDVKDCFDAYGRLAEGVEFYAKTQAPFVGGDYRAYTLAEAANAVDASGEKIFESSQISDLQTRVKSFISASDPNVNRADAMKQWLVYVDADSKIHLVKKEGDSIQEYDKSDAEEGYQYYQKHISDCDVDAMGNLKNVEIEIKGKDGSPQTIRIDLTKNTSYETDNIDYQNEYRKYLNDKADYDYQMEVFNKKTSQLQNEDKKLELKLKRLDTERNSLNTEIEAVKKVIQDSIDKGFKTFSG